MKSSFCIDLQRFMLIPTKFPLTLSVSAMLVYTHQKNIAQVFILERYFLFPFIRQQFTVLT